jgi:cell division protein ZapA (FtsZ GTPase activity inhibitor)
MDTLIPVTVVIGDRNYRIKIEPEDEEVVRKTVKTINDKIIEFKTHFAGKDMQDYVAMVLVWFATEQGSGAQADIETENISEKLSALEKMLDIQLNEK